MKRYAITLKGLTPLIMHRDNLEFSEMISEWTKDPANKENNKAGDDRCPPWSWIGYLYHDGERVAMDSDNVMTMIREGGAKIRTGKRQETYKRGASSGILVDNPYCEFTNSGKDIPVAPIESLIGNLSFTDHFKTTKDLGFSLLVKRAKINRAKHVRVRPIFRDWKIGYTITVLDENISGITKGVVELIHAQAGALIGIGDWRPGSPMSPGSFGKFEAEVKAIK